MKTEHTSEEGYTLRLSEEDVAEILDSQDEDLAAYRELVARLRAELAQRDEIIRSLLAELEREHEQPSLYVVGSGAAPAPREITGGG